jgi:hypothetical protein
MHGANEHGTRKGNATQRTRRTQHARLGCRGPATGQGPHAGSYTEAKGEPGDAPRAGATPTGDSTRVREGPRGPSSTDARAPRLHQRWRNASSATRWAAAASDPGGCGRHAVRPERTQSTLMQECTSAHTAAATSAAPNWGPCGRERSRVLRSTQMLCRTESRSSSHRPRRAGSGGSHGAAPSPSRSAGAADGHVPASAAHTPATHPHTGATAGQPTNMCSRVSREAGWPLAARQAVAEQAEAAASSATVPPPQATRRARHGSAPCSSCQPKCERWRGRRAHHRAAYRDRHGGGAAPGAARRRTSSVSSPRATPAPQRAATRSNTWGRLGGL